MDDDYDRLYQAERKTARVMSVFSSLAILIACLGLFGLSAFTAQKRVKEIGIRKVMGADIFQILSLLYKEVLILILIATAIAWPVSYFFMDRWLENFAFRVSWSALPFMISSLGTLLIAVSVTSIQAMKAAWSNPAHTLRDE